MSEDSKVTILDLFDDLNPKKTSSGYKLECPQCGLQGDRTKGFILFPETNTAFCHSSQKSFTLLEAYSMRKNIIRCMDGRSKNETRNVLTGEIFKETLEKLKEDFSEEKYEQFLILAKLKQSIQLPNDGKLISTFADELGDRMKNDFILFYRSETRDIVEISKIRHPNNHEDYNGFVPLNCNRFITLTEKYFKPWSYIYRKSGEREIKNKSMNSSVANIVLASDNFQGKMPVINRMFTIQLPILYNGKLTLPKVGYDERFGSWLSNNAPKISNPNMSVEEGKKIIQGIFQEFCFSSKQDYINAIAGFITPCLRGLYSKFNVRTPVIIYEANRERAGKDYCAGCTGVLSEGVALEEPPLNDDGETRKKVLSAMISGRKRLHFSNNKGYLNSASFEGVTTASKYSDRVLGKNQIVDFDNELEFSLSGNLGMTLTPDLANRSIFVKLFLDVEDANSREFRNPNLHLYISQNRELILSAIYSLIRDWFEKGCPNGSLPFTSFPEWAKICGGIMENCGIGNPCVRDGDLLGVSLDNETSDMKSLFELCFEEKPDEFLSKSDIKDLILKSKEEIFSYIDFDKKSDQTKFGVKLNKFVGRILSDIRLIVQDKNVRTTRWKYKFTKERHDFDKKEVFGDDFNEKNGHLGHLGHLLYPIQKSPNKEKIEEYSKGSQRSQGDHLQKTDRGVQFWDADECKDIKPACTKEEILEWIKENPNYNHKDIYTKFGIGSLKFRNELKKEGLI